MPRLLPPPPPVSPERAAEQAAIKAVVRSRIAPQAGAAQLARMLAGPTELVVPLLRFATGRRGVALAPALVGQLNAVAAATLMHAYIRSRTGSGEQRTETPEGAMPVWQRGALAGALLHLVVSPMAAGTSRWVVLPERSPLWGYLVQGALTLPVTSALLVVLLRTMRTARAEHRQDLVTPAG